MNEDNNLNRLTDIISRLVISARHRDNDLNNARELIGRLQYERLRAPRAAVVVNPPAATNQARTETDTRVSEVDNQARTETNTRVRDRSLDLVSGIDIQIGDFVAVVNPRPGQPRKGRVIGKTRGNSIKVEGRVRIEERTIVKTIRRIPENITVLTRILVQNHE